MFKKFFFLLIMIVLILVMIQNNASVWLYVVALVLTISVWSFMEEN